MTAHQGGVLPKPAIDRGTGQQSAQPLWVVEKVVLALIAVYQYARAGRASPCRFTPTCSQYAAEAIGRYGLRRGVPMTLRRLGRCRPWGSFGSDPVPQPGAVR